ncbi:putative porin [Hyphomicrobium sp. 2TAF46]|uniref:putative porin n=1 Tax=Hyphomicrobium sp. 2TAF46 TaxID=3233019 RepID=UPI003F91A26B
MSSVNEAGVRRWFALSASVVALTIAQGPAFAQGVEAQPGEARQAEGQQSKEKKSKEKQSKEDKPTVSDKKPVSPSATANLVNLLLEQGVITQEQADKVTSQVDDEAFVTRNAVQDATTKADAAAKAATAAASAASPPGSRRVSYVPEVVKRQLREDIRKEVMSQAKEEGWASPGTYPEWASRIRFHGDLRGRYEGLFYPGGGYNTDQLTDFNAINTGAPFDPLNKTSFPPVFDGNADRDRFRLRARLGMEADLSEGFTAGMRLATGSSASPVSTNQTLGGSGGNFSRYQLWLDRAYLTYDFNTTGTPFDRYGISTDVALSAGRFDNPFWKPTDLVWDDDLGFDGAAFQTKSKIRPGFTVFAAGGAFPIFNTNLDFATNEPDKFKSADKYLFGGQVGMNWQATPTLAFTMGAGLFDFSGVQGKRSSPCDILGRATACDTDHLRPSFAQKGNTYMYLRDVIPLQGQQLLSSPQYYGLASEFRPLVLSGRADFGNFHPVHVVVDGEFVWNSAFDRAHVAAYAVNTCGPNGGSGRCLFEGGNLGWIAKVTVGHKNLEKFGDWNTNIGYRYLESDAVMDAFSDSDFGLGGTNLQGYFLGGNFAVSKNVWTTAKWMSANSISGEPYAVDALQVDLNAKF